MSHRTAARPWLYLPGLIVLVAALTLTVSSRFVVWSAQPYWADNSEHIADHKVGIVLGTSPYTSEGKVNDFYWRRLHAAVELVEKGKIHFVLVSGHSSSRWYDEPSLMKRELVRLGVPSSIIYRDGAGFRTLDSLYRARDVFGMQRFVVITQKFHNERALFIARRQGMDVLGFNAQGVMSPSDFTSRGREILARLLAVLEVLVLNTGPAVLGPPVTIGSLPPT